MSVYSLLPERGWNFGLCFCSPGQGTGRGNSQCCWRVRQLSICYCLGFSEGRTMGSSKDLKSLVEKMSELLDRGCLIQWVNIHLCKLQENVWSQLHKCWRARNLFIIVWEVFCIPELSVVSSKYDTAYHNTRISVFWDELLYFKAIKKIPTKSSLPALKIIINHSVVYFFSNVCFPIKQNLSLAALSSGFYL